MKKRKIFPIAMATLMAMSINVGPIKANTGPLITNPSFEEEIDKNEVQLYKAERTNEKAYDGNYSIKVGMEKPTNEKDVPIWSYNYGKGSVNVIFHNVEPNTKYKITTHYWNETGVKMSTGALDIEGQAESWWEKYEYTPWKLASNIKTNNKKSTEWQTNEHTIITGPRTNEIYGFAYMEWTGDENGAGMFYIDDFEIEKIGPAENIIDVTTAGYSADYSKFPDTVPAIQNFEQVDGDDFKLANTKQVFSTDEFSKAKTEYLAESMVKKGIIKEYTINTISDVTQAKGITLVKKPIGFQLPATVTESKIDAYQIDIDKDKVVVYSDYIEGIQNGSMTLLQAFAQRKMLPAGSVQDYSDQIVRGLQVDSGRRYYSIDWLKNQIEQMAYYKQNKLQLRLKDNEGIRFDSKIAPELVDRKGGFWTQEEIDELVNYAAKFNIEVIPEVDFPGHAEQDANYHTQWKITDTCSNLDFSKQEVRDYMISIYKEAADMFHAKTIHIGGDEYFQTRGWNGQQILSDWAKEVTGNDSANEYDALKLFFNEAAKPFLDKGMKVLVWNDNIKNLEGAAPLDKRITVDFWAASFYRSIRADDTAAAGYNIMSSSSGLYHDLWPQQDNGKLDRPLPKDLYDTWNRFKYSYGSSSPQGDKELPDEQKSMSLGQMFPIWDDAHGYVPEYILTRTLFPRYAVFSYKTWGAEYDRQLSYDEIERLMYTLGSPRDDMYKQSKVNYNQNDLDSIITKIETAIANKKSDDIKVQSNIDALKAKIADVKADATKYAVDGFYTGIINELIYSYENLEYVVDYGKVTVKYVDKDGKELDKPEVFEGEVGLNYNTTAHDIEGYTLTATPDNASGTFTVEEITVNYVYAKNEQTVNPIEPEKPEKPEKPTSPGVKTGDDSNIILYSSLLGVALISLVGLKRKRKSLH